MGYKYTHIGQLFYFDADIPQDVKEVKMKAGGVTVTARRLFWRFYWLSK
jgi:hypothetical protein